MFVLLPLAISIATMALYLWDPGVSQSGADVLSIPVMLVPGLLAAVHIALSLRIHQRIEAGYGLMYLLACIPLFTGFESSTVLLLPAVSALLLSGAIVQAIDRPAAEVVWLGLFAAVVVGSFWKGNQGNPY